MEPNRFDEILRHKTEGFEAMPPADMFSRIESSMTKIDAVNASRATEPVSPRWVKLWSRPLVRYAAAVVAVGVVAASVVMVNRPLIEPQTADEIETSSQNIEVQEPTTMPETIVATLTTKNTEQAPSRCEIPTQKRAVADDAPMSEVSDEPVATTPAASESVAVTDRNAAKSTSRKNSKTTPRKSIYSDEELDAYWREALAEDENKSNTGASHLSTTLYAGNIGVGRGDMNLSNIADDPLLVSENTLSASPQGQFTSLPTMAPAKQPENNLQHRMPVTFGLSLSYSFNHTLAVESGLIYTKMLSTSSSTGDISDYARRRELYYIGVPLAVSYRLFDVGRIGIYTRVGGTAEKCVYGIDRLYLDGKYNTTNEWEVKELQFSLDASVGVQFSVWRGLSLYGEGGISYYFLSNQPESYRTANPLNAALRFGLRYAFL